MPHFRTKAPVKYEGTMHHPGPRPAPLTLQEKADLIEDVKKLRKSFFDLGRITGGVLFLTGEDLVFAYVGVNEIKYFHPYITPEQFNQQFPDVPYRDQWNLKQIWKEAGK